MKGTAELRALLSETTYKPGTKRKWKDGAWHVKQADGSWVEEPATPKVKTIKAKFHGSCPSCAKSINVGDPLAVTHDKVWRCPDCTSKVAAAAKPPQAKASEPPEVATQPKPKKQWKPVEPDKGPPPDKLETETCGRCGGSGKFSYNQMDGDRCYGCGGKGIRYTKRGHAAHAFLDSLRRQRLDQFKVGDLFYNEPGPMSVGHFATITKIDPPAFRGSKSFDSKTGQWTEHETMTIHTEHPKYGKCGIGATPNYMARKGFSAEEKAEHLKKALAFQATLDKKGKPKKVKAESVRARVAGLL